MRTLGFAPWLRATRSQRTADSEPVTARFGPRLSPIRRAREWAGAFAESSIAAGRLLRPIAAIAPVAAVCQRSNELTRCSGPCHQRPSEPTATASRKRPTSTRGSAVANTRARATCGRGARRRSPTISTGSAGDARASTSTVETADPGGAETEVRTRGLARACSAGAPSVLQNAMRQDQRRRDDRRDCGGPHAREKRRAGDALVMQHDQVRQVRSRQEERRGVRHEDRPVEERRLVDSRGAGRDAAGPV